MLLGCICADRTQCNLTYQTIRAKITLLICKNINARRTTGHGERLGEIA
jgi:hypothetical protein